MNTFKIEKVQIIFPPTAGMQNGSLITDLPVARDVSKVPAKGFDGAFVAELVKFTEQMQPVAAAGLEHWAPDEGICAVE